MIAYLEVDDDDDDESFIVNEMTEAKVFLFATPSRLARGSTTASYAMENGERGISLEIKRLGCEADHSPPSSAKVKNAWSYNSTPPFIFKARCLSKQVTCSRWEKSYFN
jgi:hypothetical protein